MHDQDKQRTLQQNKALHLMFKQLADMLTESGFDMKATLKPEIDIMWTPENIKEYVWRPLQKAMLQKESTTELTTNEIDKVFAIVSKVIGERTGLTINFPSIETLMQQDE